MFLSIIVPCYNESKNIPLILNRFSQVIRGNDTEVILVDNGSTDDTQTVLSQIIDQYPFARVVKVKTNQGYGFGIVNGLKAARGKFIGWTHADMQTDPQDVMQAKKIIMDQGGKQEIFVKGRRRGRPLFDEFFTLGMSLFESLYLGGNLYDINAQPNIFPRRFFETWTNPPHDFSLDLYALYLAQKQNFKIVRFDVKFPDRIHGQSSWNTGLKAKWKFIKRTLQFSFKLKQSLTAP